jgi:hypothetical protein
MMKLAQVSAKSWTGRGAPRRFDPTLARLRQMWAANRRIAVLTPLWGCSLKRQPYPRLTPWDYRIAPAVRAGITP